MAASRSILLGLVLAATTLAQNGSKEDSSNGSSSPTASEEGNNADGASGSSSSYNLTKGGMIAIIVVVVLVIALGIGSSVLFYIAKKRQWEIRKTIKRASKRVVSKANPRQSRSASRPKGMVRMDSPARTRDIDLEKGNAPKASVKSEGRTKREPMQIDDSGAKPSSERRFKTALPDSWTVGGRR